MRDPLSNVRIRFKLPLGFLVVCLVAFGIGGVVLTREARTALETQIEGRLDERAAAVQVVVERHLDLHMRRAEDFASDGFIRAELVRLIEAEDRGDDAAAADVRRTLGRHLEENKLPIVDAFVGAVLYDVEGRVRLVAPPEAVGDPAASTRPETMVSDLEGDRGSATYPTFRITTPLWHQREKRRVGALQLVVRADAWVQGMGELSALPPLQLEAMRLVSARGVALDLKPGASASAASRAAGDAFAFRRSVGRTDWWVEMQADRGRALEPATRLRDQYILIGLALLLVTAVVLFFPVRFLLQPLGSIAEAARRLGAGDFSARARHESGDEIGDLARGFNLMAEAVQDRTRRLEEAAAALGRREQEIRLERDRLDAVIRSMEDGLFLLDADGAVTLRNEAAEPLVQALRQSQDGPRRLECRHEPPATGPACLACLSSTEAAQSSCVVEREGRIYEIRATTLPAPPGQRPGRLCVGRDVTARIGAQETQAHQERMTVLGEVAAVMAHELNNPLAAISMFSQMLQQQIDPESPLAESAAVIQRNVKNCKQTIRSLLDLAARGTVETAPFHVHDLLEDVARFLGPILERAGVDVTLHDGPEDTRVLGDEVRLRQVFINLVMNAVQACERGGHIDIRTRADGDLLEVLVHDDGRGIPEAIRERIFEPFFTTKGAGVGTGLGLPTSRRIVGEHGGELTLLDGAGGGTTFCVRLPRRTERPGWQARAQLDAPLSARADGAPGETA